ncbi:MAG: cytochrome c peroxidase [Planctomycetota bacterium]
MTNRICENGSGRATLLGTLLPSIAAAVACVAATPATNFGVSLLVDQSGLKEDIQESIAPETTQEFRNEPITPIPEPSGLDFDEVTLGRALFHEPGLSRTGSIACATCHSIEDGGDDGLACSEGVDGRQGLMNSPTVLNAALNFRQFWDGRVGSLEEQIPGPIHHPNEMGADWNHILAFLKATPGYRDWFDGVYEHGITVENVIDAIAEYEKSLLTPDSPFDQWLKGDDDALTDLQKKGYELFKENHCIGCHQGVNVGGNLYEPLGVMVDYFQVGDEDAKHLGRFNVTGDERDRHVFKVPGLRNVADTAPYFHDGSATNLEDAVQAMFDHQLGMPADSSTIKAICAFLESLSAPAYESRK